MGMNKQMGRIKETITETVEMIQKDLDGEVPEWLASEMMVSQLESSGIGHVTHVYGCTSGVTPPAAIPMAIIEDDTVIYRNGRRGLSKGRQPRGNPQHKKWFGFQLGTGDFSVKRPVHTQ